MNDEVRVRDRENNNNHDVESVVSSSNYVGVNGIGNGNGAVTSMAYLPQNVVLNELRHEAFEACTPSGPAESGIVSKWRPKDRVSCSYVFTR